MSEGKKKRNLTPATVSDSDSSDDEQKPAKKAKSEDKAGSKGKTGKKAAADSGSGSDDGGSEGPWEIGRNRRITISHFKGRTMVDIREFYTDNSGEEKPGRKGICLTVDQWEKLKSFIPHVDKALES